jgi:uncharacterized OsmC-like protein
MPSIQSLGLPLAFALDPGARRHNPLERSVAPMVRLRTQARALEGMQKEALVEDGASGTVWRLVCDEGPYLNGTDLAPFPLGFFAAGLAACWLEQFFVTARRRHIHLTALRIEVDNFYTMEGSALRGTMTAGAQPVHVRFDPQAQCSAAELRSLADSAVRDSPADAALRLALDSRFAAMVNGSALIGADAADLLALVDPIAAFDSATPGIGDASGTALIARCTEEAAAPTPNPVGLQADQKRSVHVRAQGEWRPDGLQQITVRCLQPISTPFTFLSDTTHASGVGERAPSGLAYLSAGVAFCFMTQLGRYAQIAKQRLHAYRIVQNTAFRAAGDRSAGAESVSTAVYIDTAEPEQNTRKLIEMGERTCYLHAAFRTGTETHVSLRSR